MIIALVHYDAPLEEVDRFLVEHRAYLAKFYAEKKVVFSGRQNPPTGGVILFNLPTKETVLDIAKDDPFVVNKVASYELVEFKPSMFDERFRTFLDHIMNHTAPKRGQTIYQTNCHADPYAETTPLPLDRTFQ